MSDDTTSGLRLRHPASSTSTTAHAPHPFSLKRAPQNTSRPYVLDDNPHHAYTGTHLLTRKSSLRNRLHSSQSFRNILDQQIKSRRNVLQHEQTINKPDTINENKSMPKTEDIESYISQLTEFLTSIVGDGGFRAAIFGLSDGLATNLCLIIGIQFAVMNDADLNEAKVYEEIIRTGIAGIFGGALSMSLGEYISMSAQSEAVLSEIEEHKDLMEDEWDEEMDVLREILSKTLKEETIDKIMEDFEFAERDDVLELNAKIALGIDPHDVESGLVSALWSFIMFSVGGIVPLSPYLLTTSIALGAIFSVVVSLIVSLFIGYFIGILTKTSRYKTTMRQCIGTIASVAASMVINWLFNA